MDRRSPDGPPPHGGGSGGEDELSRLRRELAERDRRIAEQQAALDALVRARAVPEWGAAAAARPPTSIDTAPHGGHGQPLPPTTYGPAGPNVGLGMVANFIAGVMSPSRAGGGAHVDGGGGASVELTAGGAHTTPPSAAHLATPFLQQQHDGGMPLTTTTSRGGGGSLAGVRARTGRGSRNHGSDDPTNSIAGGGGSSGSLRSGGGSADSGGVYGGSASPYSAKGGSGTGTGKQAFGPVLMAPASHTTMATATSTSVNTTASASMSDEQLARFLQQQEEARLAAGATGGGIPGRGYGSFGPGAVAPLAGGGVYAHLPSGGSSTGGAAPDRDAALAAAMQQEEMMFASAMQAADERHEREAAPVIEDPVWGSYTGRPGKPFKPQEVLCFSMCPCCMPPLCARERKAAYARVARTACFWFSVAQIVLWGVSLHWRGFAPSDINPMIGPWPDTLDLLQAKNAARIKYWYELWRLVTPIFLHAGVIHLGTNLLMQARLGLFIEAQWGTPVFTALYLATGIFASLCSAVFKPEQIAVGASGSLMGVMGAWVVEMLAKWNEGGEGAQNQRAIQLIMAIVTISVILGMSFVPNIDWAAHVGGLVGGLLAGAWAFGGALRTRRKRLLVRWGGLALLAGCSAAALAWLFLYSQPPLALLQFCTLVVKPAYASYNLACFGN